MDNLDLTQYDFISPTTGEILHNVFKYKDVEYVKYSEVKRINEFMDMLDKLDEKLIKKLESDNLKLKDKVEKALKREEKLKEVREQLKNDLNDYDRIYGSYVSPHQLINELWRGGVCTWQDLRPQSSIKIKVSAKQLEYWLSVFQDLKICSIGNRGKYQARCSRIEAHEKLFSFNPALDVNLRENRI